MYYVLLANKGLCEPRKNFIQSSEIVIFVWKVIIAE